MERLYSVRRFLIRLGILLTAYMFGVGQNKTEEAGKVLLIKNFLIRQAAVTRKKFS